jgi:hypothetical protein
MKASTAHGNAENHQRPNLEALEPRLVPVTSVVNWLSSLYELGLDRQPDSRGLENHAARIESGIAPARVANSIFNSVEHDRSFITDCYATYLRRSPDEAGLNAHLRSARAGVKEENIRAAFLASGEFSGKQDNPAFVRGLYRTVLGREPDAIGMGGHVASLNAGASRYRMALSFLESPEALAGAVARVFQTVLGRAPVPQETAQWSTQLALPSVDSSDLAAQVAGSPEGVSRLGASPIPPTQADDQSWWEDFMGIFDPASPRVFAPYIDMGSMAQRELTWFMNDSADPALKGEPSLVQTMRKTGIEAATLAFVNQNGSNGDFIWGSNSQGVPFQSPNGEKIKADIQKAMAEGLEAIVSFGGITACQNNLEIGQIHGKAETVDSNKVKGTGQNTLTLRLDKPVDFANMETGSLTGRFLLNGAITELFTVKPSGEFTLTHQVKYEVPKATKGRLLADGQTISLEFDKAITGNLGESSASVSYGLTSGFQAMRAAYQKAIQYFYDLGIRHIDLDIEGPALSVQQWGINNQRHRVFKSFQDEGTFPGMKLSYVLPIGPNTGWHPITDPGRLIQAAGQIGLEVSTWNMMAFDYGPQTYRYMLKNGQNMVDMLVGQADTGIKVDDNFPIKGAVDYLVDFGLAKTREEAFTKIGVTLMIGQDDTLYVAGDTPSEYTPGDAATVEAITPEQVGGSSGTATTVLDWALAKGVGLLSFWSLGRDRPSFNTAAYNPSLSVAYQTGSPAVMEVQTESVDGGGQASVILPFQPVPGRPLVSGGLYRNNDWLGDFTILGDGTLKVGSVSQTASPRFTGGMVLPGNGQLRIDFDGPNSSAGINAKVGYQPKILKEYQDKDLVYTQILNRFDD